MWFYLTSTITLSLKWHLFIIWINEWMNAWRRWRRRRRRNRWVAKLKRKVKGFKRFQEITEEMGEIIKKVRKLGSSQEKHFVPVSLPARTPCPNSPPLSRSTPSDSTQEFELDLFKKKWSNKQVCVHDGMIKRRQKQWKKQSGFGRLVMGRPTDKHGGLGSHACNQKSP